MKLENFRKLKVGDKVEFEHISFDGRRTGKVTFVGNDKIVIDAWYGVSNHQVICKIVKKPKLKFVGYGIFSKEDIVRQGNVDCFNLLASEKQYEHDTHEVYVRPIRRRNE